MSDEFIGFLVVVVIATTIYKIIKLKHGGRESAAFRHELAEELADRDDRANALEERVRVLEKIVTENHRSGTLSEEIEKLQEKANG